jgi:hypothetical protein
MVDVPVAGRQSDQSASEEGIPAGSGLAITLVVTRGACHLRFAATAALRAGRAVCRRRVFFLQPRGTIRTAGHVLYRRLLQRRRWDLGWFKIVGFPQEWYRIVVANASASLNLGDPLGDVGANIAFPIARDDPCLHLYRVDIVPLTEASDVRLDVTRRTPPSNPSFECPMITTGCVPCFTALCAESVGMTINGTGDCTVPVAKSTWGTVKQLYSSR